MSDSVQYLASEDSVQYYSSLTLGSASSQDSVVYCGTVRPSASVKLQSTGVVLSKVKEEPATETKTFVAEEAGIEAKEEPAAGSYETKTFVAEEAGIEAKEEPLAGIYETKIFVAEEAGTEAKEDPVKVKILHVQCSGIQDDGSQTRH